MTWATKVPLSQLTLEQATGAPFPASTAVNVYMQGTTTPVTLYTDASGGTTIANPTTIDSSGNAVGFTDPRDLTVSINGVPVNVTLPPSAANIQASLGTASTSLFLRGDLTWTSPGSGSVTLTDNGDATGTITAS